MDAPPAHGNTAQAYEDPAVAILDDAGAVVYGNPATAHLLGRTPDDVRALPLGDLLATPADWRDRIGDALTRGHAMLPHPSGVPLPVAFTAAPLPTPVAAGHWLVTITPDADRPAASRGHRDLTHDAAILLGASLDVGETAGVLARILVADCADLVTVDLAEEVVEGNDPPSYRDAANVRLRRVAAITRDGTWPPDLLPAGRTLPPLPDPTPMQPLMAGEPSIADDMDALRQALSLDANLSRLTIPEGTHSSVAVPLYARGLILGCATLWRTDTPAPFDAADAAVLAEVCSRAALSVDNARRYTRERRSTLALQRSLLPRPVVHTAGAETAGRYLPAGGGADVGGDWFDVIPLSSLRVAFVVGDVVGHGLGATATMGRLRTAVLTLADLNLDPGELLTHLDDLVISLSAEADEADPDGGQPVLGATCLYAVYDPVDGRCALAGAGHPPPAVVSPNGDDVRFVDLSPGPPLGVGGMPFETAELTLEPGSLLAFYTDGLVEQRGRDVDVGMDRLCEQLRDCGTGRPLGDIADRILADLLPTGSRDDVALLIARTQSIPADDVATWKLAADPAEVGRARELACAQLAAWGLDDLAFTTELVVSELVTNAIRYAGGPVGLRLIRRHVLVCEVSDPSNTQPRLRRAQNTDEGGRGLFLVAQLTTRWGSRYTATGKTIWTEQALDPDQPGSDAASGP